MQLALESGDLLREGVELALEAGQLGGGVRGTGVGAAAMVAAIVVWTTRRVGAVARTGMRWTVVIGVVTVPRCEVVRWPVVCPTLMVPTVMPPIVMSPLRMVVKAAALAVMPRREMITVMMSRPVTSPRAKAGPRSVMSKRAVTVMPCLEIPMVSGSVRAMTGRVGKVVLAAARSAIVPSSSWLIPDPC